MQNVYQDLSRLRRPGLLMRAVRHALAQAGQTPSRRSMAELPSLFDAEAEMEATRRRGDASYTIAAHVALLTQLIRAVGPQPVKP